MNTVRKYVKIFSLGFQSGLEYRADFLLRLVSGIFVLILQCFLWTAVFNQSETEMVYGYTYSQMITYSIISILASQLTSTGFQWEIADDIKLGGMNKYIAQPVNYTCFKLFSFLGKKLSQIMALSIWTIIALIGCTYFLDFKLSVIRLLLFIIFILLAIVVNFLIYYCLSALAFVMLEVWGVFTLANQTILFLSGGVFPLDVFGDKMNQVLSVLPFKYIVFYPINILNGRLSYGGIAEGAFIELIWIIVLTITAKILWMKNMKKYVAVGG